VREFVKSTGFQEVFDEKNGRTLLGDEAALMQFGSQLLKQVLFGECAVPLKRRLRAVSPDGAPARRVPLRMEPVS
jgi:hypothetical protein